MARSRFAYAPIADVRPIGEMNTTPLIDVLLVLLIMFILTVPVATHKVALDLPVAAPPSGAVPTVHRLMLDRAGAVTLDGAGGDIAARLRAIAASPDVLRFDVDPDARYERADRLLATVKRAGVTRMSFAASDPAF